MLKILPKKKKRTIILNKDLALISKKLVTLKKDVELPVEIKELDFKPLEVGKLIDFLDELEFSRIKASVISKFGNQKNNNKSLVVDTIPEKEESQQANNTKYYISEDNPVDRNKI